LQLRSIDSQWQDFPGIPGNSEPVKLAGVISFGIDESEKSVSALSDRQVPQLNTPGAMGIGRQARRGGSSAMIIFLVAVDALPYDAYIAINKTLSEDFFGYEK
jgi:hypothetical protein